MPAPSPADWPFDQAPDCVAVTQWQIIKPKHGKQRQPILYVSHDADDHGWQFLDGGDVKTEDGALVGMGEMLALDPTLREVADLPPGWIATRSKPGAPWKRSRRPEY